MSAAAGPADQVFTGGAVYTVDPARPWAEAVAVRDGRITAVGADEEVRPLIGPRTAVIELTGRMLLPGFQDSHVHPVFGGLQRLRCDLSERHSLPDYLAEVRAYVERHPERPWVVGGGWAMDVFPGGVPTAAALDRVVADRPVYLSNRDGHGAWVNTRALELAGIDASTADPGDGRIERDAQGCPTGALHEGAMDLVSRLAPAPTAAEYRRGLLTGQEYLHQFGITGWQDAIVEAGGGDLAPTLDTYRELAERGELTARVVGALWWDRHRGLEQLPELVAARDRVTTELFRPTSVKIMQDGVCEDFTAAVLDPYLDGHGCPTDRRGLSFVPPELLNQAVPAIDRAGFQVHFHAIGERAVREALDAIACARRANGMNDLRPHIAHIQVIHPDDLARFAELGVVANAQPLWAANEPQMTDLTIPFLGPQRSAWQYPFASLHRLGARLAFGSDWSVSSPNPLWEIHVAVNRLPAPGDQGHRLAAGSSEVFLAGERLDLATALHAFTMGSAYVNHLERETGSITCGKQADLVVVDRNLFREPAGAIADARVVMTEVAGRPVYIDPRAFG
ncbi:MAG TPA: amidohydrolase [Candidatus Micrarchaeia archaeon]|nr:amidohydrolase [Candidatus Micrarchaeia archaeon]